MERSVKNDERAEDIGELAKRMIDDRLDGEKVPLETYE